MQPAAGLAPCCLLLHPTCPGRSSLPRRRIPRRRPQPRLLAVRKAWPWRALCWPILHIGASRRETPLVPDSQKTPPWASKGSWERPASPSPSQMRRTPGPSASVHQSPRCAGLWVLGVRSSLSSWGKQIGKKKGRKEERREEGESMQKAWKVLGFL